MQLGKYQSNIRSLSSLSVTAYERIFKLYEGDVNNKTFFFYNILKKIEIPDTIDDQFVSFYTSRADMPLTIVSYNIYNDMQLWWLIYLLNSKALEADRFVVKGGTQLQYIKSEYLVDVLSQIARITQGNGRHYD